MIQGDKFWKRVGARHKWDLGETGQAEVTFKLLGFSSQSFSGIFCDFIFPKPAVASELISVEFLVCKSSRYFSALKDMLLQDTLCVLRFPRKVVC